MRRLRVCSGAGGPAHAPMTQDVPDEWKGGQMAAVPRRTHEPLSMANSRSILCANVAGKVVAKVVRQAATPALVHIVGGQQCGGIPHGGTEYSAMSPSSSPLRNFLHSVRPPWSSSTSKRLFTTSYPKWPWGLSQAMLRELPCCMILASPRKKSACSRRASPPALRGRRNMALIRFGFLFW